jgi:hypothetical protein
MSGGTQAHDDAVVAALRARFGRMVAVLVVCVIAAVVGMVCYFAAHQAWGLGLFVAALVSGFAAQVWFVAAMRR